jgi:hypothetical protein
MIDWERNKKLLLDGSEAAIRKFLAVRAKGDLCAIGYVFELWNASPQFDLCANTTQFFQESMARHLKKWPDDSVDDSAKEYRWNSGCYQYSAGLLGERAELGAAWDAESDRLHELADADPESREVYDGLIRISCDVLVELASRRVFGDWSALDFNVSEVGDAIETVQQRDREIKQRIASENTQR